MNFEKFFFIFLQSSFVFINYFAWNWAKKRYRGTLIYPYKVKRLFIFLFGLVTYYNPQIYNVNKASPLSQRKWKNNAHTSLSGGRESNFVLLAFCEMLIRLYMVVWVGVPCALSRRKWGAANGFKIYNFRWLMECQPYG